MLAKISIATKCKLCKQTFLRARCPNVFCSNHRKNLDESLYEVTATARYKLVKIPFTPDSWFNYVHFFADYSSEVPKSSQEVHCTWKTSTSESISTFRRRYGVNFADIRLHESPSCIRMILTDYRYVIKHRVEWHRHSLGIYLHLCLFMFTLVVVSCSHSLKIPILWWWFCIRIANIIVPRKDSTCVVKDLKVLYRVVFIIWTFFRLFVRENIIYFQEIPPKIENTFALI